MTQIPSPYDELPLLKDLPVGTELTIVGASSGKTEKNSYPCVTLETREKKKLFSIEAGVITAFQKIGAGADADVSKFDDQAKANALVKGCKMVTLESPLLVRTAEYKNKYGTISYTIKNRV